VVKIEKTISIKKQKAIRPRLLLGTSSLNPVVLAQLYKKYNDCPQVQSSKYIKMSEANISTMRYRRTKFLIFTHVMVVDM
jgi:hypothetical protein